MSDDAHIVGLNPALLYHASHFIRRSQYWVSGVAVRYCKRSHVKVGTRMLIITYILTDVIDDYTEYENLSLYRVAR